MVSVSSGDFVHDGHRLVYYEYGSGDRPFLLLPGLLLPQAMHRPLAQALAERGNRVITLDLLGHGESDHPRDMWRYSMPLFGEQAVALLEHLEIDDAIVGGTSLGANVTLEAAALAPERMRGLVIEMPVLDNALLGCALAFTPLLLMLTCGAPLTRRPKPPRRAAQRGGRGPPSTMSRPVGSISPSSSVCQNQRVNVIPASKSPTWGSTLSPAAIRTISSG